jgi:hypothetical protein
VSDPVGYVTLFYVVLGFVGLFRLCWFRFCLFIILMLKSPFLCTCENIFSLFSSIVQNLFSVGTEFDFHCFLS